MLTKFDDYPIHQTPEPVSHPASTDRNVYDRYWFNGFADDGEFYFGVGIGAVPEPADHGLRVQHRAGRRAARVPRLAARDRRADRDEGRARSGSRWWSRCARSRVTMAPNETGIECDLTFSARTACIEEGRQTMRPRRPHIMDATRFTQFGRWEGSLRYGGRRVAVDPKRVYGTKDRSWGIRPVGEPELGGAPARALPQIFFLWAPIQWGDFCTHCGHLRGRRRQRVARRGRSHAGRTRAWPRSRA